MAGVLLRVIYGSQTGHGAKYAALLHGAARRHRVVSELWDLRDCHDIDASGAVRTEEMRVCTSSQKLRNKSYILFDVIGQSKGK